MASARVHGWFRGVAPAALLFALASPAIWLVEGEAGDLGPLNAAHASVPAAPEGRAHATIVRGSAPQRGHVAPRPTPQPPAVPTSGSAADTPPTGDAYACRAPNVAVERTAGCDLGLGYPACRWRLPDPWDARHFFATWRNTSEDHRSARPGLVSLLLATAAEYARLYPGEELAIGDLDAPGPRHETHDEGVDVDLYLPGMMAVENLGAGEYENNYAGLGPLQKRMLRARVESLARILATCTAGRLRIYYNDPPVNRRFRSWFEAQGYESPFGNPMQEHNDLHRFHFHVTVPRELGPLPVAAGAP